MLKIDYKFIILLIILIILKIIQQFYFRSKNTKLKIIKITDIIIFLLSFLSLSYLFIMNKEFISNIFLNKSKLVLFIYILSIELIIIIFNKLNVDLNVIFNILFSSLFILFVNSLFSIYPNMVLDIIFISLFMIYSGVQDFYYGIFNEFFSFTEVLTLRDGLETGNDMYHFKISHLLIVALSILSVYFYISFNNKIDSINHLSYFYLLLIIFIISNINMQYPLNKYSLFTSDHYLYKAIFSRKRFVKKFGLTNLLLRDLIKSLTPKLSNKRNINKINKYYKNKKIDYNNDLNYQGIYKNKKLIYILAESFDEKLIPKDKFKELYPNLYKLKEEGIHFNNFYTPVYPKTTSDTEFMINTGLIPSIEDGPTCYVFNRNYYSLSLANLFKNNDYKVNGFHNNHMHFYNRNIFYPSLGYDKYIGKEILDLDDETKHLDTCFIESVLNNKDFKVKKSFNFLLTYSGHAPYTNYNIAGKKHYKEFKKILNNYPDEFIYYLASQKELDLLVGELLKNIDKENTIIMFSNDHFPYTVNHELYDNYTNNLNWYQKQRGTFVIWDNGFIKNNINNYELYSHKLASTFDILPTINYLFDLKGNEKNYMGVNIFSNHKNVILFKNYTVYDGKNYLNLYKHHLDNQELIKESFMKYYISKKILRCNYFR